MHTSNTKETITPNRVTRLRRALRDLPGSQKRLGQTLGKSESHVSLVLSGRLKAYPEFEATALAIIEEMHCEIQQVEQDLDQAADRVLGPLEN